MKDVQVFKAIRKGELRAWGLDREDIEGDIARWLGSCDDDLEEEWRNWKVVAVFEDAHEVIGVRRDWNDSGDGAPLFHVHWPCPICGREHLTDVPPSMESPQIWRCDRRGSPEEYILVSW